MRRILYTIIIGLCLGIISLTAQVRVAIVDFDNQTNRFHLDSWQRLIPDLLQNELSASKNITLVTRDRLEALLEEQALLLSGVINPGKMKEVGKLLDAEFIITGSVLEVNRQIHISAELIRVKTGEVLTESVRAPDPEYLETMISMLANNLNYQLTGTGAYQEQIRLKSSTLWYFLGAGVAFGAGAWFSYQDYQENWDAYLANHKLKQFDRYYDRANTSRKWSIGLTSLAAASLTGTLISWINNQNAATVYAGPSRNLSIEPFLNFEHTYGYKIGLSVHF